MKVGNPYLLNKPKTSRRKRGLLIILASLMLLVPAIVYSVNIISIFNSFHNIDEWARKLRPALEAGLNVVVIVGQN